MNYENICPACELTLLGHTTRLCNKRLSAIEKYGYLPVYQQREQTKGQTVKIFCYGTHDKQVVAAKKLLRAYFARSIEDNGYRRNHPLFKDYAAMLLFQTFWKNRLSEEVYNELVQVYGTKPGIPNGNTVWNRA